MFTRHLEDKPSAYGFVLYVACPVMELRGSVVSRFNRLEDAERFIITLRQHTPFHPSFAKVRGAPFTLAGSI
jgi:hypothetical protein